MAYGSTTPPPKKPPAKRKPTPGANNLSPQMLKKLQAHQAKGHSAKHMSKMRVLLKEGRSFSQSHAMSMKMVGK
mgnify:FL=1